jgi:hypothetical protein
VLHLVITRGVDVLNVTHLGRGPTAAQKAAQRAALLWMNPTCSVQGCTRSRLENDHREPWAQTQHTRLDELDPLYAFHHDLKTRLGWALVKGQGQTCLRCTRRPATSPPTANHERTGRAQEADHREANDHRADRRIDRGSTGGTSRCPAGQRRHQQATTPRQTTGPSRRTTTRPLRRITAAMRPGREARPDGSSTKLAITGHTGFHSSPSSRTW